MDDLAERRQALIEEIKQAFPRLPSDEDVKGPNLVRGNHRVASERLRATFEGKSWEEAVSNPSVVYNMSDVDHLWEITDEAYLYYLPAFLTGTLLYPDRWVYYSFTFENISKMLSKFSPEQLDVLIAFLDFHVRDRAKEALVFGSEPFLEEIEAMLQRLIAYRNGK